MLNGYNRRFPKSRSREYLLMHPSSRHFSIYTRFTVLAMSQWIGLLGGNLIGAMITGHLNPFFFPLFLTGCILLSIRYARSYRIEAGDYNEYLLPIEMAYNKMSRSDRRRYKKHLENAYRLCSKNYDFDFTEINSTLQLFKLTADEEEKPDKSEVVLELEALKAKIEQEKEIKKLRDEALRELEQHNGH